MYSFLKVAKHPSAMSSLQQRFVWLLCSKSENKQLGNTIRVGKYYCSNNLFSIGEIWKVKSQSLELGEKCILHKMENR